MINSKLFSIREEYREEMSSRRLYLHNLPRTELVRKVICLLKDVSAANYLSGPPDVTFKNEPGTWLYM